MIERSFVFVLVTVVFHHVVGMINACDVCVPAVFFVFLRMLRWIGWQQ